MFYFSWLCIGASWGTSKKSVQIYNLPVNPLSKSMLTSALVFAKSLKMLPSTLPWNLRIFKGNPQSTLEFSTVKNLELIQISLENIALVLPLYFKDFQGSTLKNLDHKILRIKVLEHPWWTEYFLSITYDVRNFKGGGGGGIKWGGFEQFLRYQFKDFTNFVWVFQSSLKLL